MSNSITFVVMSSFGGIKSQFIVFVYYAAVFDFVDYKILITYFYFVITRTIL